MSLFEIVQDAILSNIGQGGSGSGEKDFGQEKDSQHSLSGLEGFFLLSYICAKSSAVTGQACDCWGGERHPARS